MYAQQLGFVSSWKMLTRDKGWIKPLLILTLVGWIPILGQIAILGYGLEWARLTAWGVDAAPKQRGVAYGKVLSTGGIAFLLTVTMGLVLGAIDLMLFGGWYPIAAFPMGIGVFSSSVFDLARDTSILIALVILIVNLLMGTFATAAMVRATIYDNFAAGWRVDRLFQMIGRDPRGFLHAYGVSLIGGLVTTAYSMAIALVGSLFAFGGVMGFVLGAGLRGSEYASHMIQGIGPGIIVLAVVLVVVVMFFGGVIGTAMQLISINAVGQWFCRFDVGRWGVSSAPLPDGVPYQAGATASNPYAGAQADQPPRRPDADASAAEQPAGASEPAAPAASQTAEPAAVQPVPDEPAPVVPASQADSAPDAEPASERGPILLGPISTDDGDDDR